MRDPIHPGETLRDDLDALGMSAAELARRIDVPVNRVTEILNGRRTVTGDTAPRLGPFLRYVGRVLAQPPEALRAAVRGTEARCDPEFRQRPTRGGMTAGRSPVQHTRKHGTRSTPGRSTPWPSR